jgi:hypothetical protein
MNFCLPYQSADCKQIRKCSSQWKGCEFPAECCETPGWGGPVDALEYLVMGVFPIVTDTVSINSQLEGRAVLSARHV